MRIQARKLLQFSTDELWDILDGPFTLVFDDGELLTDHKETLFSSYAWDLIREYSALPFTSRYHFSSILQGGTMGGRTFSTQYSRVVWDIYRHYCAHPELLNGMSPVILREVLSKKLYDVVAKTYNDLTYRLEEYVMSTSIEDFIEIVDFPELQEIHNQVNYTEAYVEHAYEVAKRVIVEEPEAAKKAGTPNEARAQHNVLSRLARANLIDMNQLNQCVVMRGFMTDIGSHQFTIPITSNLVTGIRGMYESLIESRSASKSLAFQAKPLQDSEFFNRRSQMGAQVVTRLLYGDCGSTEYNYWAVRESDLPNIEGKYYYCDKEQRLLEVKRSDTHLVGTTIKMRSPMSCMAPDPNGVCETCFGALANAVYRDTNIGMQTTSYLNEIISQAVLGVKHLDGSSKIEPVTLDEHDRRYFSVTRTGDGYTLQNAWKGKPIKLIIRPAEAPGFTDIREVSNVRDLSFTRTTMLDTVGLDIEQNGVFSRPSIQVGLLRRPASFTHEMLSYIREHGWELDSQGNYVVNLEHWDPAKVMMVVPRRNFNMSELHGPTCSNAGTQTSLIAGTSYWNLINHCETKVKATV